MGLRRTNEAGCAHDERDLHRLADAELGDASDDEGRAAAAIRGRIAQCPACRRGWDRLITMRRLLVAATVTANGPRTAQSLDRASPSAADDAIGFVSRV
jgi:hypothetical protein